MLKNLFNNNPLLKVLLPLLLICGIVFVALRVISPQMAYREELRAQVTALNEEAQEITNLAESVSSEDKQQLEDQLQALQINLGLGLASPELVQQIEERAEKTRIKTQNYSFAELLAQEGFIKRKLTLVVEGTNLLDILAFQLSLEEFPPFMGTEKLTIIKPSDGGVIEATLTLSFSDIPTAIKD